MGYYQFGDVFSPPEFIMFVRDLLEIREGASIPLPSQENSEFFGHAKGYMSFDDGNGQRVLIHVVTDMPSFPQLVSYLQDSELLRVLKLKPHKYLLVIQNRLNKNLRLELLELGFQKVVKCLEVLDEGDLNRLIRKKQYQDLYRSHAKLSLGDFEAVTAIFNQPIYDEKLKASKHELSTITNTAKVQHYVQSGHFLPALEVLDKHNVVLITGDPGIGKTTLGRSLILYHLLKYPNYEFVNILNLASHHLHDIHSSTPQIFFFDDFWGDIFESQKWTTNEDRYFIEFVAAIEKSANKKLILTSRDYVLEQGKLRYASVVEAVDINKLRIQASSLSRTFQARIIFNYVYFSNLNLDAKRHFGSYGYQKILGHKNFSPRIIERYIQDTDLCTLTYYNFQWGLKSALDDPYQFWLGVFQKHSTTSQILLLILVLADYPTITETELKKTFKALVAKAQQFNLPLHIAQYKSAMEELDTTFLEFYNREDEIYISFQNPSIKDFLLKYLAKEIETYGPILISCCQYFEQLSSIFTTQASDLVPSNSSESVQLQGDRIVLPAQLGEMLLNRIIQVGFALPNLSEERYYSDIKPWIRKAFRLLEVFPLDSQHLFRTFILKKISAFELEVCNIPEGLTEWDRVIASDDIQLLGPLTEKLANYYQFEEDSLIQGLYNQCQCDLEDMKIFHQFSEVFPEAYERFVQPRIKTIRNRIRELILEQAGHLYEQFLEEEYTGSLWRFLDEDYPEMLAAYGMYETKAFRRKLLDRLEYEDWKDIEDEYEAWDQAKPANPYDIQELSEGEISSMYGQFAEQQTVWFDDDQNPEKEIAEYLKIRIHDLDFRQKVWNILESRNFEFYHHRVKHSEQLKWLTLFLETKESLPGTEIEFNVLLVDDLLIRTFENRDFDVESSKVALGWFSWTLIERQIEHFDIDQIKHFNSAIPSQQLPSWDTLFYNLYPLFQEKQEKYHFTFRPSSKVLAAYAISKLDPLQKAAFYREKMNVLFDVGDITTGASSLDLLHYLSALDDSALKKYVFLPMLKEITKAIDNEELPNGLACLRVFSLTFSLYEDPEVDGDLCLDTARMTNWGWSDLLLFLEIPLNIENLLFFFEGQPDSYSSTDFFVSHEKHVHLGLKTYLDQHCSSDQFTLPYSHHHIYWNIDLGELVLDEKFQKISAAIGLTAYLEKGVKALKETIASFEREVMVVD